MKMIIPPNIFKNKTITSHAPLAPSLWWGSSVSNLWNQMRHIVNVLTWCWNMIISSWLIVMEAKIWISAQYLLRVFISILSFLVSLVLTKMSRGIKKTIQKLCIARIFFWGPLWILLKTSIFSSFEFKNESTKDQERMDRWGGIKMEDLGSIYGKLSGLFNFPGILKIDLSN